MGESDGGSRAELDSADGTAVVTQEANREGCAYEPCAGHPHLFLMGVKLLGRSSAECPTFDDPGG